MAKQFGFGPKEHLKSRKRIEALFATGAAFSAFPLRVAYKFGPPQPGITVQAGFTASKKHFKKAVDRNRIKRLMREAYRLQKANLVKAMVEQGKTAHVFFIYTDKTIARFETVQAAMARALSVLGQKGGGHEGAA